MVITLESIQYVNHATGERCNLGGELARMVEVTNKGLSRVNRFLFSARSRACSMTEPSKQTGPQACPGGQGGQLWNTAEYTPANCCDTPRLGDPR